jgi:hypothetical protein
VTGAARVEPAAKAMATAALSCFKDVMEKLLLIKVDVKVEGGG